MPLHIDDTASQATTAAAAAVAGAASDLSVITARLAAQRASARVALIGDSTLATDACWGNIAVADIAAKNPAYTVERANWNKDTGTYASTVTVQTGTAGQRYALMATSGRLILATASYPNPTGIQEYTFHISNRDWTGATPLYIASNFGAAGSRGIWVGFESSKMLMRASSDGTNFISIYSTATLPAPSGLWVRFYFNPSNAESKYEVKFWTSSDGTTWSQLGDTVVGASAATVFSAANDWSIGTVGDRIYFAQLRTTAALLNQWPMYIEGFSSVNTTFSGAPVLHFQILGYSGGTTATWADATRLTAAKIDPLSVAVVVALSHNELNYTGTTWTARLDTLLTALRGNVSGVICFSTQNPQLPAATYSAFHESRAATLQGWCRKNGVGFFDASRAFFNSGGVNASLIAADNLHPTADGYAAWGNLFAGAI